VYDPGELSTPAYPGDASDDSALSDLSDEESDFSDSSAPARGKGKGKGSVTPKGKGKGKAGFAGTGRRLADGEDVKPQISQMGDGTAHIGYVERYPDETDEDYDRRCFRKYQYDQGAVARDEFKRQERKLKKELGRKLTNGEKNHIRLVKVC
jgi:hypothetical protein